MSETAGEKTAAEVAALIKSRNALIWVVSPEEGRVERSLIEAITNVAKYDVRFWDVDQGVTDATGAEMPPGKGAQDIGAVLGFIRDDTKRAVWIMRDAAFWLRNDPTVRRRLRNLARSLPAQPRDKARAIVVLSTDPDVPPDLVDHAIVVKWKLPDRAEVARILDNVLEGLPPEVASDALAPEQRDAAIEAAVGLSAEAASAAYSKSLVTQGKRILPAFVATEKKRVVSGKGIDWFDADPRGLDAIGGLENLKPWLVTRKLAFTQEARDFGLPPPKGIFLVGVPGCGKSLTAKATATVFDCPLLRADFGGAQSKWVGESQQNIRAVFAVAEAVGRCVLWIDEIEKMLAGATNGAADGGVSADALGTFLSWMQDRKGEVFVIATSNDVRALPPELLRKGRWDDLFFVDLPTAKERAEILTVTLKQYKRPVDTIDIASVVKATQDFTGSEIAALLPDALFAAFADGKRELRTGDLMKAAAATVPLAKTSANKIEDLRNWSKGKARPASLGEASTGMGGGRNLDM